MDNDREDAIEFQRSAGSFSTALYTGQAHEKASTEFFAPIGTQFGQGHLHFRQAIS
jgi:hypothetical protein